MEEAKKPSYKYCIVPECKNTIKKTPDKVFFRIPNNAKIRKRWCKVMRRDNISPKSCLYCCEDHFNVQEETENYIEYNIMKQQGEKRTLRLKKGVVPHIFFCQIRTMPLPAERMAAVKRQRLTLVNEALSEIVIKSSDVSKNSEPSQRSDDKVSPSTFHTNVCDISQPRPRTSRIECDDHQILTLKWKIKEDFDLHHSEDYGILNFHTQVTIKREDLEGLDASVPNISSASHTQKNTACGSPTRESHIEKFTEYEPENTMDVTVMKENPGSPLSDVSRHSDAADSSEKQAINIELRKKMEMLSGNEQIIKRRREEISFLENNNKELLADIKYLQNESKKKKVL